MLEAVVAVILTLITLIGFATAIAWWLGCSRFAQMAANNLFKDTEEILLHGSSHQKKEHIIWLTNTSNFSSLLIYVRLFYESAIFCFGLAGISYIFEWPIWAIQLLAVWAITFGIFARALARTIYIFDQAVEKRLRSLGIILLLTVWVDDGQKNPPDTAP